MPHQRAAKQTDRLTDWNEEHVSGLNDVLGPVNRHSEFAVDDIKHLTTQPTH